MAILKLATAGESATLVISRCEIVEGQYGEQAKFTDETGDILFLPRTSADRQLERLGFVDEDLIAYERTVGETLTFSRAPSNKPGAKPFWNIARGNGSAPPKPSGKRPVNHTNVPNENLPPLLREQSAIEHSFSASAGKAADEHAKGNGQLASYKRLTEFVLNEIEPMYAKADIGLSPEAAAAVCATLFIQEMRGTTR